MRGRHWVTEERQNNVPGRKESDETRDVDHLVVEEEKSKHIEVCRGMTTKGPRQRETINRESRTVRGQEKGRKGVEEVNRLPVSPATF